MPTLTLDESFQAQREVDARLFASTSRMHLA